MVEPRDEEVRKGAHCARQIHYYIVVPVKYRKALLDEEGPGLPRKRWPRLRIGFRLRWKQVARTRIISICSAVPIQRWLRGGWYIF